MGTHWSVWNAGIASLQRRFGGLRQCWNSVERLERRNCWFAEAIWWIEAVWELSGAFGTQELLVFRGDLVD